MCIYLVGLLSLLWIRTIYGNLNQNGYVSPLIFLAACLMKNIDKRQNRVCLFNLIGLTFPFLSWNNMEILEMFRNSAEIFIYFYRILFPLWMFPNGKQNWSSEWGYLFPEQLNFPIDPLFFCSYWRCGNWRRPLRSKQWKQHVFFILLWWPTFRWLK